MLCSMLKQGKNHEKINEEMGMGSAAALGAECASRAATERVTVDEELEEERKLAMLIPGVRHFGWEEQPMQNLLVGAYCIARGA